MTERDQVSYSWLSIKNSNVCSEKDLDRYINVIFTLGVQSFLKYRLITDVFLWVRSSVCPIHINNAQIPIELSLAQLSSACSNLFFFGNKLVIALWEKGIP